MAEALSTCARAHASATDFLIASKKREILDLEGFLRMGRLVVCISNLVHSLQRERGATNLFLGAEEVRERFSERLQTMIADADQQMAQFQFALDDLDATAVAGVGNSRLLSRIAYAVHALSEIEVLRGRTRALALTPESAVKVYSELIRGLLAIVFEAADIAMDPTISRTLVAMFNFMQGKELAGQERAAGAAGFVMGRFDANRIERLSHLLEAQARCFNLFEEYTDSRTLNAWQAVKDGQDYGELARLRSLARPSDDQTEVRVEKTLADHWFSIATGRVDAMKAVEDSLEERLQELCKQKLHEARENLARHQSVIETLLKQEDQPTDSFILFCNTDTATEPGLNRHADLNGQMGRSVMELVQYQSQRLQEMNDELNTARAALEERKLLDRAKALLMKHRKMTEEEAYRLLRQTAMNQSRRLVDVARAMVAVGEVWARPEPGRN